MGTLLTVKNIVDIENIQPYYVFIAYIASRNITFYAGSGSQSASNTPFDPQLPEPDHERTLTAACP